MQLAQKGASAVLEAITSLIVEMSWTCADDFDLAASLEKKDGSEELIYYRNKGNLNAHPFVSLDKDAGVGDKVDAGGNKETLRIAKLDDVKKVHLLCWDYPKVRDGGHARFAGSDLKISVKDGNGMDHSVSLDAGDMGNCICLATIDNTNPIGAKFINVSKVTTFKGFPGDSKEFLTFINA